MLRVAVCFKALRDPVSDLQQACACVLELLLVGQTLIRFVQLLKGLFHRPHALLTNTKGFLVELIVLLSFDGNGLRTGCDVNRTLSLLPFGCFSLLLSGLGSLLFLVSVFLFFRCSLFFFVLLVVFFLLSLLYGRLLRSLFLNLSFL